MRESALLPSVSGVGGMFLYLVGNPWLFVHQTTVMTVAVIVILDLLILTGQTRWLVARLAPLALLILAVFGLGALALSVEIWIRFHPSIPVPADIQLVSGVGHFVAAGVLAVPLLLASIRGETNRWLAAAWATVLYYQIQVVFFEPPWFSFQGQRLLILRAFWVGTFSAIALLATFQWKKVRIQRATR